MEGNGQTELAECIMGMRPQTGGRVLLCGEDVSRKTPGEIRRRGVSFIPEDRMTTGVDGKASVAENLLVGKQRRPEFSLLGGLHLRRHRVKKYAAEQAKKFDIRMSGVDDPVSSLSGGNMQKVVIAREFSFDSPVLVVSQPTRGVDIGAKYDLHARIREIVCEIRQKVAEKGEQLSPWLEQEEEWRSIKERGILRTEDAYSFKTIADICQKCFGKDANYRIQRSFFHVADDRMLWCPKLAIELPDGLKVAQSRGWINELSADWNVIIEHNDSGATPVKHPDKPRYTFAKSKDERGEDAYRFIGIFEWSETTPSGEHIYKRMASDMKLK